MTTLLHTVVPFYSHNKPNTTLADTENKSLPESSQLVVTELRLGSGLLPPCTPAAGRTATAQPPSMPTPHACRETLLHEPDLALRLVSGGPQSSRPGHSEAPMILRKQLGSDWTALGVKQPSPPHM